MNKLILCLAILQLNCVFCRHSRKLHIDIFCESLCPDSQKFIINQLGPSWDKIKHYVHLNLVPFGKSKIINNLLTCQHGERECEGNRVMSCAFDKLTSTAQVNFTICFMETFYKNAKTNRSELGQDCVKESGLNWHGDIQNCLDSDLVDILQRIAQSETKEFDTSFIPTIVYNKTFYRKLQHGGFQNFQHTTCREIHKINKNANC